MPRLRTVAMVVWLILQPVLFHGRALISKTTYLPFDLPGFHTPLATVVVEALREGRVPLWDPYIYGGYPLHADIQAQILYPPAWPAFLLGAAMKGETIFYWLEWETALHIALAGLFTAWLLRRSGCGWWASLFGATVFQLGCFFSAQAQHLGAVCGAAWMPLAWLAVMELARGFSTRWFAALAGALALTLLAGFPAMSLIVFGSTLAVVLGHWWTGRARAALLLSFAGAVTASLALATAQLVPTAIWGAHSMSSLRWMFGDGGGLPPRVLVTALWPDWFHTLSSEQYRDPFQLTFMYLYNGQAAIWLALAAPWLPSKSRARLFAVLAGLFAVVMLGKAIPGYQTLLQLLPRFIRGSSYVEYSTAAFSLAIAVAAALALNHLSSGKRRWIAAVVAILTSAELMIIPANRMMNSTQGDWKLVDSPRSYFESERLLKQLKGWLYATVPPQRTDATQHEYRFVTVSAAVRLPSLGGDNPFAPLRMLAYRRIFGEGLEWERVYTVKDTASPLLDAGNVGFLLYMGDDADEGKLKEAGWDRVPWDLPMPLKVFRNREVMPRYFLVGQVRRAGSAAEAQEALRTADPRSEAVVEGPVNLAAGRAELPPVAVVSYRPDRIELNTTAAGASYLVVAEGWAPGWEAQVDGERTVVYPTNLAFQGLPLAAGQHRVVIEYRPLAAYAALGFSILAWLAMGAWVWKSRTT